MVGLTLEQFNFMHVVVITKLLEGEPLSLQQQQLRLAAMSLLTFRVIHERQLQE